MRRRAIREKSRAGGYHTFMTHVEYLALDDAALLAQCDMNTYRSSGPGGQHRNKVSSAVRLRHRPTGISAHGDDSRSQHDNKVMALARLRMNLALQLRHPVDPQGGLIPPLVAECIFSPRGPGTDGLHMRLRVGRKDHRFWAVAAFLLDVLEGFQGRLADAAKMLNVTTSNLGTVLQSDRHLLGAAQQIRKAHGQHPLA